MRYVQTDPISDRVVLDVTTPTVKGLFNWTDWRRVFWGVQNNIWMIELILTTSIDVSGTILVPQEDFGYVFFEDLDREIIPLRDHFTSLVVAMNLAITESGIGGVPAIGTTWGYNLGTFDYEDVNEWEDATEAVRDFMKSEGDDDSYPWVADSGSPVRRARVGQAFCNSGLTRNNSFRRYA